MGHLYELAELDISKRIAVGICHSGQHVGLLYRTDDQAPVRLFHLCAHRILRNEPPAPRDKCALCVVPSIEPEYANAVVAHAIDIWEKNLGGTIPYGFSDPRGFFDSEGNIAFGPGEVGLTCASIILAIFDLSGFPLLRYDTWEARDDDADALRDIIRSQRPHYPGEVEHFDRLEAQVEEGTARFRPLEVAGGALADDPPIDFESSKTLASQIQFRIGDA
jgi:hypothetical protein